MNPEDKARQNVDDLLVKAGWILQDSDKLDLSESVGETKGIAVRELRLGARPADYVLMLDRKAVGVIEAKKEGTPLSGIADQSMDYMKLIPKNLPIDKRPAFHYESTGVETKFRDIRDPIKRSRYVFAFHKPKTLRKWFSEEKTLRARLQEMPSLNHEGFRQCQIKAIENLEESFAKSRPKSLIQMASGSGKTYTAVSFVYRLIKFAKAKRILFLVDRNSLGIQTATEFKKYVPPDENRSLRELYPIQHLKTRAIDPSSKICITTIQRLYSVLKGKEIEEEVEEKSLFEESEEDEEELPITYNPDIPIEEFDFIITDECHRSIYNKWRQVLEYFDSMIIGLTATPSAHTIGFFDENLVMEYTHEEAVADKVNVGFEIYRINTDVTKSGGVVSSEFKTLTREKLTRKRKWGQLDQDVKYTGTDVDRSVVVPSQIRAIIREFKKQLFTNIFPGRKDVPKTLIFAKTDSHAEDIVEIVRNVFDEEDEFCKKITYKAGEKPDILISKFRTSYNPRIAVTVDMIATGIDIRPLECVMFMRDVNSRTYFEQMVGRGTRVLSDTELQKVTRDAKHKDRFVVIDAIGVFDHNKIETRPLERSHGVSFKKLVENISRDIRDEDTISSLAGRLAALDGKIDNNDRNQIQTAADGVSLNQIIHNLLDATNPDKKQEKAQELFNTKEPTKENIIEAGKKLIESACNPFDSPTFRDKLLDIHQKSEQIIDVDTQDRVITSEFNLDKSKTFVTDFKEFVEKNKDRIVALQIIYNMPYKKRKLTFEQIKELGEAVSKLPNSPTPDILWRAYGRLQQDKVKDASATKVLVDLVQLVRFAMGKIDILEKFSFKINSNYQKWLDSKAKAGVEFSLEQKEWLERIKNHISNSSSISKESFELNPFIQMGGLIKLNKLFGEDYEKLLDELNEVLVAS